jgi:hypothetical protein
MAVSLPCALKNLLQFKQQVLPQINVTLELLQRFIVQALVLQH